MNEISTIVCRAFHEKLKSRILVDLRQNSKERRECAHQLHSLGPMYASLREVHGADEHAERSDAEILLDSFRQRWSCSRHYRHTWNSYITLEVTTAGG
jgi:hypothetical protein